MKKHITVMLVTICFILLSMPVCFATTSSTPMPQEENSVVHSGKRSLKFMKIKSIDGEGNPSYVEWGKAFYGYLSLQENKTYLVSMWVKIPEAKNRTDVKIFANLMWVKPDYVEYLDGRTPWITDGVPKLKYPTPGLEAARGQPIRDDKWHQIICYYTVAPKGDLNELNPSPGTSDTYGFMVWTEESESADPLTEPVYIDDLVIAEADQDTDEILGENLFENPGFEDKLSRIPINWSNAVSVYYGVGTSYTGEAIIPDDESTASKEDEENKTNIAGTGDKELFVCISAVMLVCASCMALSFRKKKIRF